MQIIELYCVNVLNQWISSAVN